MKILKYSLRSFILAISILAVALGSFLAGARWQGHRAAVLLYQRDILKIGASFTTSPSEFPTAILCGTPEDLMVIDQSTAVTILGASEKWNIELGFCLIKEEAMPIFRSKGTWRERVFIKNCILEIDDQVYINDLEIFFHYDGKW